MPKGVYTRHVKPVHIVIGPSIAYVELTQGLWSLIDRDDAELVGKYNWCAARDTRTGSFYASGIRDGKNMHMNRFLLQPSDEEHADHKNMDTLDNRRSNLRPASFPESGRNRRMYKSNKCGLKGVYLHPNGKYKAQIRISGKITHLGYFDTATEAHKTYCSAAKQHYGEFARAG